MCTLHMWYLVFITRFVCVHQNLNVKAPLFYLHLFLFDIIVHEISMPTDIYRYSAGIDVAVAIITFIHKAKKLYAMVKFSSELLPEFDSKAVVCANLFGWSMSTSPRTCDAKHTKYANDRKLSSGYEKLNHKRENLLSCCSYILSEIYCLIFTFGEILEVAVMFCVRNIQNILQRFPCYQIILASYLTRVNVNVIGHMITI